MGLLDRAYAWLFDQKFVKKELKFMNTKYLRRMSNNFSILNDKKNKPKSSEIIATLKAKTEIFVEKELFDVNQKGKRYQMLEVETEINGKDVMGYIWSIYANDRMIMDICDLEKMSKQAKNSDNKSASSKTITFKVDTGAPEKGNGNDVSNEVIRKLSLDLNQYTGSGDDHPCQYLLDISLNGIHRRTNLASKCCLINSIFLALAKKGLIKASTEAYIAYIKYCYLKKWFDVETGSVLSAYAIVPAYDGHYTRLTKGDKGVNLSEEYEKLQKSEEGTVFILNARGHWVTSTALGNGKIFSFDTGYTTNVCEGLQRRPAYRGSTQQTVILGNEIKDIIIIDRK